ncbi:MAG TPA: hypothetical protein VFY23_01880 [Candidatus Limnocylindrales bacterium]|nr:hypothetical protein [Candidatus Limnocylindrales bacterium]
MTDRSFEAANGATTDALRELTSSLSDEDLAADVGEGWTVAMALAHLAYWDSYHAARWRHAAANGLVSPPSAADEITGRANEALEATWRALPGRVAATLAVEAAEAMDALAHTLRDDQVDEVRADGHPELVARHPHRGEHIEQIGRALGRA